MIFAAFVCDAASSDPVVDDLSRHRGAGVHDHCDAEFLFGEQVVAHDFFGCCFDGGDVDGDAAWLAFLGVCPFVAVDAFAGDAFCGGLAGADELLWLWSVDGLFGALPAVFDFVGCLGCFFGFGEVDEVAVEPLGVTLGALFSGPGESVGVVGAGVFDPCAEYVVEVVGYFGGSFVVDVGGFAFAADSSVGAVGEGDLAAEGGVEVVADPVGEFVESGCCLLDFGSGEVQVVSHAGLLHPLLLERGPMGVGECLP